MKKESVKAEGSGSYLEVKSAVKKLCSEKNFCITTEKNNIMNSAVVTRSTIILCLIITM